MSGFSFPSLGRQPHASSTPTDDVLWMQTRDENEYLFRVIKQDRVECTLGYQFTRHRNSNMSVPIRVCVSLTVVAFALNTQRASAQGVTLQQPVVQQFGVDTVVSVPDRGSALLGSVSSAQSFGGSRGPALPSSRLSRSVNHSGVRAHVFIHDFEAMDKAVLSAADGQRSSQHRSTLTGMAVHAQRSLLQRHAAARRSSPAHAAEGSTLRRFGSRTLP